jgi:pimeloyl-ACP methyl ester carboxylesterase
MPPVEHVQTELLDIAFEREGPDGGPPVVLLHGWPDDVRTWDRLRPALHELGFQTIAPYLRGYGPTRFRSAEAMRSGQLSALGQDLLDFADALGLAQFTAIGHDWGARAAYIAAALAPERVARCVALSVGWGTNDPDQPLSLRQARNYWYHWYFMLERGARLLREQRRALARFIWETWGPPGWFSEAEFEATAGSLDNPDWAEVCLHSYRHRWGLVEGDPRYAELEARLRPAPVIRVPTLVVHGGADPANDPSTSEGREQLFAGPYQRVVLDGVGHFPSREAPEAVARALRDFWR